jgi:hypothetical protein
MPSPSLHVRVGIAAFVLQCVVLPLPASAQQAKVSLRVAPIGSASATPLFKVEIVEPQARRGFLLPSLTLTKTQTGPRVTNLALALPDLTFGETAVAPRLGDQQLPRMFSSSPVAGASLKRPIRGLSFSTKGSTPWALSIGQLHAGSGAPLLSSGAPAIVALAADLAPRKRLAVAPRVLVPLGGRGLHTNVGAGVRAELTDNLLLVSDVGAADAANAGWVPLGAAGVVAHWAKTEVETSVLRGAPSLASQGTATISSIDRELVRGQLQPVNGLTFTSQASRSRRSSATDHSTDTTAGSIGVTIERLPYGQLAASRRRELNRSQEVDTTSVEWRPSAVSGFVVRFAEIRPGTGKATRELELDLPGWFRGERAGRMDFHALVKQDAVTSAPTLGSRLKGRVDVTKGIGLTGETELGLTADGTGTLLRGLRLASDVEILKQTALQVLYTHRPGLRFTFDRAFEARVSRTIDLIP